MKTAWGAGLGFLSLLHGTATAAQTTQSNPSTTGGAEESVADTAEETDSNTIVVTATRTGAPLEQLPVSATVIDEQELAQQLDYNTNILRAVEFAAPGVSPQGEGRIGCFVGIRGR